MSICTMRFARLLPACALTLIAGTAQAQLANAPVYRSAGNPQAAIGVFCLNPDNSVCTFGGSGAAPAGSSIGVQRTTGIGTTGVQVSASDPTNRRTVKNTSGLVCELMGSAAAYGAGHPLQPGDSFTFDSSGRTTAALFVACSAAGGSVSVLSY